MMEYSNSKLKEVVFLALASSCLVILSKSEEIATENKGECVFPAIFNFGDSNSDTGGFSATFGQAGPPHGETFFHSPAGRYCDGRLIIDFIAQSLGLPYLSGYLDAVGSNFSHGANFATAGSPIRPQNTTLHQSGFSPISLNYQFYEFSGFHQRTQIIRQRGNKVFKELLPKAEYFSKALYTFDIGQNDLTAGLFLNMSTDEVKANIPDILGQFATTVQDIYSQGGRYFWIHNTGPLGCLPYVMDRVAITAGQVDDVGCAGSVNEVAQVFNRKLKEVVDQLRKKLAHAALTYVDVYSLKYDLISNATKHGFEHPLRACCGHGGKYNYNMHISCGGKVTVKGKQILLGRACKDPSVAINWDGVHYTEAANKWIFDRIVNVREVKIKWWEKFFLELYAPDNVKNFIKTGKKLEWSIKTIPQSMSSPSDSKQKKQLDPIQHQVIRELMADPSLVQRFLNLIQSQSSEAEESTEFITSDPHGGPNHRKHQRQLHKRQRRLLFKRRQMRLLFKRNGSQQKCEQ